MSLVSIFRSPGRGGRGGGGQGGGYRAGPSQRPQQQKEEIDGKLKHIITSHGCV